MKTQNLLSILLIVLGTALLLYFSHNGVLQKMARRPDDLVVAFGMLVVVSSVLFVSLTQRARVLINRHGKLILRIGIAMVLFSLLSPLVLLCVLLLIEGNSERLLPDNIVKILLWGNFGMGFVGLLVAMTPANIKLFEYLRTTRKR